MRSGWPSPAPAQDGFGHRAHSSLRGSYPSMPAWAWAVRRRHRGTPQTRPSCNVEGHRVRGAEVPAALTRCKRKEKPRLIAQTGCSHPLPPLPASTPCQPGIAHPRILCLLTDTRCVWRGFPQLTDADVAMINVMALVTMEEDTAAGSTVPHTAALCRPPHPQHP